jgi:hypothetical protein
MKTIVGTGFAVSDARAQAPKPVANTGMARKNHANVLHWIARWNIPLLDRKIFGQPEAGT